MSSLLPVLSLWTLSVILQQPTVSGQLKCYQCTSFVLDSSTNSLISALFSGKLNTDPTCGVKPTSSNTIVCPSSANQCGIVTGDVSANIHLLGEVSASVTSYDCVDDNNVVDTCVETSNTSNSLLSKINELLSFVGSDVQYSVQYCTCDTNLCTTPCSSGFKVSGDCVQYWIIGVSAGGLVLLIIIIITSYCCCCRNNHKRNQVAVVDGALPIEMVAQQSQQNSMSAPTNPPPSILNAPPPYYPLSETWQAPPYSNCNNQGQYSPVPPGENYNKRESIYPQTAQNYNQLLQQSATIDPNIYDNSKQSPPIGPPGNGRVQSTCNDKGYNE